MCASLEDKVLPNFKNGLLLKKESAQEKHISFNCFLPFRTLVKIKMAVTLLESLLIHLKGEAPLQKQLRCPNICGNYGTVSLSLI